ncbi:MAG: hypothetical protein C0501_05650 [Isosphaera sp.]|nr:hypothetical protein [Isosphaera sp.]
MDDVAHVEIRRSGARSLFRLWLGVVAVVVGAGLTWMWMENDDVLALLLAGAVGVALGAAAVGTATVRAVDRSVRLALTGEGLYLYRRRRPLRWVDIRGVRLLTTKTKLGGLHPVLHLVVESRGLLRTYHVNLMDLDHSPERITLMVQDRVRRVSAAHLPPPLPAAHDPTLQTGPSAALPAELATTG